ncbi:MAG: hypothetical protein IPJ82_02340 [Lewinellaceae bacterium]|nr:hypothetical protein [Lewinellaceae bacterium]
MVTRSSDGGMDEVKIGEMPYLIGSSAEFIPNQDAPRYSNGVFQLDNLDKDTSFLVIFWGIQSSQPNIFFINTEKKVWQATGFLKFFRSK